jgi:replicative DNA helicase
MVGIINAGEYGRAIHDAWHRRQLIDIAHDLADRAFGSDPSMSAMQVQEAAESRLFELAERNQVEDAVSPAHEAMRLAIDAAVKASQTPSGLVGISTGLTALDDILGGLKRGSYYVLGARPSMGKTSLGIRISVGAVEASARVLFISREMTRVDIGAALTAGLAGLPRDAAERGRIRGRDEFGRFQYAPISQADVDAMIKAQRAMIERNMMIDECRSGTMASIRAATRRMKRRGGCDLVVIDYLGLLNVPELSRAGNRELELSRLSADAKALARDLDVPVLMLAQLNRANEAREDKRPGLADLRGSGAIEQDADVVMFLHRDHYYLTRTPASRRPDDTDERYANRAAQWAEAERLSRGRAEVMVAKQRRGPTGTRFLAWNDEAAWFGDVREDGA